MTDRPDNDKCETCLGRNRKCKDCRGTGSEAWAKHYLYGDPLPFGQNLPEPLTSDNKEK